MQVERVTPVPAVGRALPRVIRDETTTRDRRRDDVLPIDDIPTTDDRRPDRRTRHVRAAPIRDDA